jgi:two-component system, NtrC family, sensor kinase
VKIFLETTRFILLVLLCVTAIHLHAQTSVLDSLRKLIHAHLQKDTVRVNLLNDYGLEARKSTSEEAFKAFTESLEIARSLGYKIGEANSLLGLGFHHRFMDETKLGLSYTQDALNLFESLKDTLRIIPCYYNLTVIYSRLANFEMAIKTALEGLNLAELINDSKWRVLMNFQLGEVYLFMRDTEKGENYFIKSLKLAEDVKDKDGMAHALGGLGETYDDREQWDSARYFFEKQLQLSIEMNDPRGILQNNLDILTVKEKAGNYKDVFKGIYSLKQQFIQLGQAGYLPGVHSVLANSHLHTGNADSALHYAFLSLNAEKRSGRVINVGEINKTIAEAYAMKNNFKEAYKYQDIFSKYMDSLNITNAINKASAQKFSFDLEKKQSQISLLTKNEELVRRQNKQQKIVLAGTLAGLLLLIGFSILLWRNNRSKQKAYNKLEQQQEALKATQAQLIQSEKMASLGELTAGIAHEIQNPLNFVNNFSEVNTELVDELQQELKAGKIDDALAISNNIKDNEQKINHHGKRADAIVKGMLQHSRSSSGIKEPTDINALADEYLRLAYHGLRAKDKSFNTTMKTDFDENLSADEAGIGKISIIPQDIGRVLLNLYNNAFYVVTEKKKQQQVGYEPTVSVSTRKINSKAEIKVADNGNGIPQKVLDKIFQPFFTTKPTGQGTGLGLSMSYDIVKAHGGEIKVNTREGEFTEFVIQLPILM